MTTTTCWVLRQNYGEITDQNQMRDLIAEKKIVTCPWGGWGVCRDNVISRKYNIESENGVERSSCGQDKKFVENIKVGDFIIIPFAGQRTCILAKVTSNVIDSYDTGLNWEQKNEKVFISSARTANARPFMPVIRHIEIINANYDKPALLGRQTLCKYGGNISL